MHAPDYSHDQGALVRRLERHFAHGAHLVAAPSVTILHCRMKRGAECYNAQQDADGPYVALFVVRLALAQLRGQVVGCAHDSGGELQGGG